MGPKSYEKLTTLTSATLLSATVYEPGFYYPESLSLGTIGAGTGWAVTQDWAIAGNAATYTDSAHAGTLSQAAASLARTGRSGKWYDFTYTTSTCSGDLVVTITTAFALAAVTLPGVLTAGVHTVRFQAAVTPGAFTLSGTSASGAVTFDDLSLLEIVEPQNRMQVKRAVITVEVGDINFTVDSSTPTETSGTHQGHLLKVGDVVTLSDVEEIRQFRCINAVASNGAVLKVTYSFA